VAPGWSPAREDFCVELAGTITAEQTTLVERAEMKAERLDELCEKRANDANAYAQAASDIGQRFSAGQPILLGHHSQRKAERDAEKMQAQFDKSIKAAQLSDYWCYRANGVDRHVNRQGSASVRLRKIKTLLADLRSHQRKINFTMKAIQLWEDIASVEDKSQQTRLVERFAGGFTQDGDFSFKDAWQQLNDGELTTTEIITGSIDIHQTALDNPYRSRWIRHLLGRLSYERLELGDVQKYSGDLTATILQTFTRTHGADKPKATKAGDHWTIKSPVHLPLHIANGHELTLSAEGWVDLMQSCGYSAPLPKPKAPPILNFKAQAIKFRGYSCDNEPKIFNQVEMTKAEYSDLYPDKRRVMVSACGQFRVKVYFSHWSKPSVTVFITDSKIHPVPDSESVIHDQTAVVA
jgi:hypothetical protein